MVSVLILVGVSASSLRRSELDRLFAVGVRWRSAAWHSVAGRALRLGRTIDPQISVLGQPFQIRVPRWQRVRVRWFPARSPLGVCHVLCSGLPRARPTYRIAVASVLEPMRRCWRQPWRQPRRLIVFSWVFLRSCAPERNASRACPVQDFALHLWAKRRLCNTVGRIVKGCAADCCVISAARARAATMTNLASSSRALVLCAIFGAAKELRARQLLHDPAPDGRLVARRHHPTTNKVCPLMAAISWHA